MRDERISGVAITGSVARLEAHVHDIDLIIFHDGRMRDGSVNIKSCSYHRIGDGLELLSDCFSEGFCKEIFGVLRRSLWDDIPANLIFVHEKILGDCGYLQSFLPHLEKKGFFAHAGSRLKEMMKGSDERERVDEFYSTVFCDIPLLLIDPREASEAVSGYFREPKRVVNFSELVSSYPRLLPISHLCGDARCKPMKSWVRQRWEIKKERGYACVEELQRAAQNGLSLSAAGDGALSLAREGGELSLVKK